MLHYTEKVFPHMKPRANEYKATPSNLPFFLNPFSQNGNHSTTTNFPHNFFDPLLLFQEQENQETETNPPEQREQPLLSKTNPNPTLNQPKTLHPNKNPGP